LVDKYRGSEGNAWKQIVNTDWGLPAHAEGVMFSPPGGAETLGMWLRPAPEQLKAMEARGEMRAPTL